MKQCPYCAEDIQQKAVLCRHCGKKLEKNNTEKIETQKNLKEFDPDKLKSFLNPSFTIPNKKYIKILLVFFIFVIFAWVIGNLQWSDPLVPDPPAFEIPAANLVSYNIVQEEDISIGGCKRIAVSVTVPDDSKATAVQNTLQSILENYKSDWEEITVWAWKDSEIDLARKTSNTMGMKEYSICS